MPPAENPEAAFDMIAAANLQPAATLELDSAPDPDNEEPPAADAEETLNSEPEANVDQVLLQEDVEDEDIPLEEVNLHQWRFSRGCCLLFDLKSKRIWQQSFGTTIKKIVLMFKTKERKQKLTINGE